MWGRTERPSLTDTFEDPLVFDLEFGISLCFLAYLLPEGVVLARVGRDVGEDRHLVDVGIIFGVYALEFRMERSVAVAGKACESLVDLDVRIALAEVGVVIFAGHPARHGVGDLVGLGFESFTLNNTTEGF